MIFQGQGGGRCPWVRWLLCSSLIETLTPDPGASTRVQLSGGHYLKEVMPSQGDI